MDTKQANFNWESFLLGIIFIGISFLTFRNPTGSLAGITIIIGLVIIIKGAFDIFVRNRIKALTGTKSTLLIVTGILDIVLGVILLLNINIGILTLPYLFAIWFLIDSIGGFFTLDLAKLISPTYYWLNLIITIMGIVVGISLLFNPLTSALTLNFLVGFYLMWYGIMHLVRAFIA